MFIRRLLTWSATAIAAATVAVAPWSEAIVAVVAVVAAIALGNALRAYFAEVGSLAMAARHLDAGSPEVAARVLEICHGLGCTD